MIRIPMALGSQGFGLIVTKPFFIRTSASFLIFCLEQPSKLPDCVKVNGSFDCLTMDNSINCLREISGRWLSNSVCSLFVAINSVLKIAFC